MNGTTAGKNAMKPRQADQSEASERKRGTESRSDGWCWCTQTRKTSRSSTCQGSPLTLYLTITLSGCQRPTDLVICKLYFEGAGRRRGINQRERRDVRSSRYFPVLPEEKCEMHSLLGFPCGRKSHSASGWGWLWPWSGWWGFYWPDRCCNMFSQPVAPCLRGSRCAGRSRPWARPVGARQGQINVNVSTEGIKPWVINLKNVAKQYGER